MLLDSCFEISIPDVVAEDFGTEIVVLNLSTGKYFSLLGVAVDLWNDIVEGHRPQNILNQLESVRNECTEPVRGFVLDLIHNELIRPVQAANAPTHLSISRTITALEQGNEAPKLEAFDDMAELILSDPIHDVEEDIGWPAKRKTG